MKNQYAFRTFTCKNCQQTVTLRRPENKTQFCSLDCYRSALKPEKKTGENKKCFNCGTDIYVTKGMLKEHNFCTIHCLNEFQGKDKTLHICETCNKEFKWSPSRSKSLDRNIRFCSIECRNKSDDWRKKSVYNANFIQNKKKGLNKLELAGNTILDELNLSYSNQVLIGERFTVDVLLNDYKVIIQWDGDYWHGLKKDKNGNLDVRQQKRVNLDKSENAYFKKCGYVILRFWEHEVLKNRESVIENIKTAIRTITK